MTTLALVAFLAACSGSFEFSIGDQSIDDAAEDLIEGDLSSQLELPLTDATCEMPGSDDVGTVFGCTALYQDQTVDFEVTVDRPDHIVASTTNLLVDADLRGFEAAAIQLLNDQNGAGLGPDAMDCGAGAVVLGADDSFVCALVDGAGATYDTTITITDWDTGAFSVNSVPTG